LSEVVHMRRIPRARVKLIRVHKPQPVGIEYSPVGGGIDDSAADPFSPGVVRHEAVLPEPDPAEGLTDAYSRGVEEGKRIAEAAFQGVLDRMRAEEDIRIATLLTGISEQMKVFQGSVANDAYRFSLAVAERIIHREVALSDDVVITQIKEAIQRIVGVESIKIRVHPLDEAIVRSHRAAFLGSLDNVRDLVVEGDEGMERGGCILESASGNVDARISTQLQQIEVALFGISQKSGEPLP
jgi:flagellar assembly protein FliH